MNVDLMSFVLQESNQTDVSMLPLIISGAAAAGVTGGLILNWRKWREENNVLYVKTVSEFDQQLAILTDKQAKLSNVDDAHAFTTQILNLLDRIAFLLNKGKIPKDFQDYFKNWFSFGLMMLEFNKKMSRRPDEIYSLWPALYQICIDEKIEMKKFDEYLPPILQDLLKQKSN